MRADVSTRPVSISRAKLPEVRSCARAENRARYALAVPETLVWFAGHFPGHPVLPGVAQLGWAVHFARAAFGFPADPLRIDRVKFLKPVQPGDTLELELWRAVATRTRVEWRFARGDMAFSRGRFEFAAAP